ncbi:hypothetical protein [Winogradskyella sp.]|uniref:hypothetical protein n=1 Tax=Winogradskyella sp. TaxID=1883156 RepID=UPI003AB37041
MALLGKIIKEDKFLINIRPGEVVSDVIIEKDYLQLRTYAMGDIDRERGFKQNIQLSKEKAKELIILLEQFVNS